MVNMIQLMKKQIFPERLECLFECPELTEENIGELIQTSGGTWRAEDGWLVGENRECSAAMAWLRGEYFGDVLVEFDASTMLPATHDINVTWHGSRDADGCRDIGYVMGVEGFWDRLVGFEKSPKYDLLAQTALFSFEPGRIYHITVGNIGRHLFLAIDGKLALSVYDPDPIDSSAHGLVGFEAFCTRVRYGNIKVKRLEWVDDWKTYTPEF